MTKTKRSKRTTAPPQRRPPAKVRRSRTGNGSPRPDSADLVATKAGARPAVPPRQLRHSPPPRRENAAAAERILLERYCAAAFLITGNGETVYLYGRTEPYLARRSGASTLNLLAMLRTDLRAPLRRVLRRIARHEIQSAVEDARVRRDRQLGHVRMTVVPAAGPKSRSPVWLVILQDLPVVAAPAKRIRGAPAGAAKQLQEELRSTQHDLQDSVEQLEASNQDLKSANEELVTVNEELQVANEEMQSSKEELQSVNEELQIVNQQLQSKVVELETSGHDLSNLLESSQIINVCFDSDLRVRWFAPAAGLALKLLPNDIGRSITTFADAPIGPTAVTEANAVLRTNAPAVAQVQWNDRWYLRRLIPYHVTQGRADGLILTLTDITESKRAADVQLADHAAQAAALEKAVAERTTQLRELSIVLTLTEERERRAVAVDLHDDLGQLLALLKIRLDLLQRQMPSAAFSNELKGASDLLVQASDRVRSLAFQLSPTILYELGLVPALEWLADEMKRLYSVTVTIDADAASRAALDPTARTLLFRAVRELLINVGKHANAPFARVICRRLAGRMLITVTDEGKGFDPKTILSEPGARGFGLISIRERLASLGGTMDCQSIPGDGSKITLQIPASAPAAAKEGQA